LRLESVPLPPLHFPNNSRFYNIYYDLAQPENAYLQLQIYALARGGSITPLPETGSS